MFAHGSHGDANHRGADAEAYASTVADANIRSDEAALPLTDASAERFSKCTTDRATVGSANRPSDG